MRGGNRRGGKFTADRPLPRVSALYFDFFLTLALTQSRLERDVQEGQMPKAEGFGYNPRAHEPRI
jgi:hypothetical protein